VRASDGICTHEQSFTLTITQDTDGDGIPDVTDLDDDNDGILDTDEGDDTTDTDGDGTPDSLDTDSDNDGCSDAKEAGFTDADGDGEVDGTGYNSDGTVAGSDGYTAALDSNNNGVLDHLEAGPDADGDGIADACDSQEIDTDGDGIPDVTDLDDDNDGIYDTAEGDDTIDTDGDGTPDYLDTDSDGDGCSDAKEAGFTDADEDGQVDGASITYYFIEAPTGVYNYPLFTSEEEANFEDLRNGGTGTSHTHTYAEDTQGRTWYMPNTGNHMADSQAPVSENGVTYNNVVNTTDNAVVQSIRINSNGTVYGSDGYSVPADTDNSGIADHLESGIANCLLDTDGDGTPDITDLDDDNDGILDTDEGTGDTDGDGTPDSLDTDSDNDGCSDAKEAGFTDADDDGEVDGTGYNADGTVAGSDGYTVTLDSNNNGVYDHLEAGPDADGDGIADACDSEELDTDGDGIPDVTDLDDDNDGILDTDEGTGDTDGDGTPDSLDT
ncbi:thrombospondin type 3 repeat-containing protein, partial [Tenacibaculum sp. SG-28]|uniref:thrombospondin type 3 repeat-containing protein n=1 Tax=Tenacibaculum sp. SG-28 TaxID=754426 RepID=UPI000D46178D